MVWHPFKHSNAFLLESKCCSLRQESGWSKEQTELESGLESILGK